MRTWVGPPAASLEVVNQEQRPESSSVTSRELEVIAGWSRRKPTNHKRKTEAKGHRRKGVIASSRGGGVIDVI